MDGTVRGKKRKLLRENNNDNNRNIKKLKRLFGSDRIHIALQHNVTDMMILNISNNKT